MSLKAHSPALAILALLSGFPAVAHPSSGIAVDHSGNLYISDLSRGLIRIDARGQRTVIHREGFHWLALDEKGSFAAVDFDSNMPTWLKRRSPRGSLPAILTASDSPIALGNDGSLYYTVDGKQIACMTPDKQVSPHHPKLRGMDEKLGGIRDLAAGPDGSVYASYASTVLRIAANGNITSILSPAALEGCSTASLRGLAVDSRGTVYVAAAGCRRVLAIAPDGKTRIAWKSEPPWSPSGVTVHQGSLYVLEHVNGNSEQHESWRPRVTRIDPNGTSQTVAKWSE